MRDLKADLEICNRATPGPWEATSESDEDVRVCQTENEECVCCLALMGDYNWEKEEWKEGSIKQWNKDAEFIAASREGWPHAIERAIKAETEVERLKPIEEFADKNFKLWENAAYTMNAKLRAENAKLRKVVEAARIAVDNAGRVRVGQNPVYDLRQALAELDKEGER